MSATADVAPVLSGPAMFWTGMVIGAGFGIVTCWLVMTREQRARERADAAVACTPLSAVPAGVLGSTHVTAGPTDVRGRVLRRDGDQCRYCRILVNPLDRRGARGRVFSRIDRERAPVLSNFVVACRACSARPDGDRFLMPPPSERGERVHYHPTTAQWLASRNLIAIEAS